MWEDPIVAEIHRIRAEILAEFDGDLHAYYSYIRSQEEEDRMRGVTYVSLQPRRPPGYKPEAA